MKILFYRYGSICEPDLMDAFSKLNIDVVTEESEITDKSLTASMQVGLLARKVEENDKAVAGKKSEPFLFIFSINYFPSIAEFAQLSKIPYVCWTVDCPVLELFSNSIKYDTNFIFLFDRTQYEYFYPQNPGHIFYLPLATNVNRWDQVIKNQKAVFGLSDISFVGSLYHEKCKYHKLILDPYVDGYVSALCEAQMKLYGCNIIEEALEDSVVEAIKAAAPSFYSPKDCFKDPSSFVVAHDYIGYLLAEKERIKTLDILGNFFEVKLYTNSDPKLLGEDKSFEADSDWKDAKKQNMVKADSGLKICHGVRTLDQMPLVFNNSRINMNITMRPIASGLSLRVFDILGCGGFLMTNYQSELPEYFEIGQEVEAYSSFEELVDKCDYYLKHEDERSAIAQRGYEKVKLYHNYDVRIAQMIQIVGRELIG